MADRRKKASATRDDAISLLKADHRQVEGWFSEFESTKSSSKKQQLATKICHALTVHTKSRKRSSIRHFCRQPMTKICTTKPWWSTTAQRS